MNGSPGKHSCPLKDFGRNLMTHRRDLIWACFMAFSQPPMVNLSLSVCQCVHVRLCGVNVCFRIWARGLGRSVFVIVRGPQGFECSWQNWARTEPSYKKNRTRTSLQVTSRVDCAVNKQMTLHATNWDYCPTARCNMFCFLSMLLLMLFSYFILLYSVKFVFFLAITKDVNIEKMRKKQEKRFKSVYVNRMQHTLTECWGKVARPRLGKLPPSCKKNAYVAMLMLHTYVCVLVCTCKNVHVDSCYGKVPHEVNNPNLCLLFKKR